MFAFFIIGISVMNKFTLFLFLGIFSILNLSGKPPVCISNSSESTILLSPVDFTNQTKVFDKSKLGISNSLDFDKVLIPIGQAAFYQPENEKKESYLSDNFLSDTNWMLVDSNYINTFLPVGANVGVMMNFSKRKLELVSPYKLTETGIAAVKKSPLWIRPILENTLSKVGSVKQIELANIINNANDPYIDEIAYSIAYSAPAFLNGSYCYPNLFIENAKLIYSHDSDLKYVEIIDYGSSSTDENYYSTVKYFKIDTSGKKVQIEVPKEIYYEYIVNPKTSDEIATYIDPSIFEHDANYGNHIYNISAPPTGVFWRDFLYNFTEEKSDNPGIFYPVLKDSITKCEVLWDEKNIERSAVREVGSWVRAVMKFDSKSERPHQPARIYKLHLGRCGEHEDLTNSASRACLIPCRGIEAYSSDHVWNEFWDEKWWQEEPVNNSYKDFFCYSKGWGKKFGSVIARSSSGPHIPVTDSYCENTAKITLYAKDVNNLPIDGALLQLAVMGTLDSTSIFIDNYGVTDNEGKFTFTVDANRDYYARMDCSLGNDPIQANNVYSLVKSANAGQLYQFQLKATSAMPKAKFTALQLPVDTLDDYKLIVKYSLKNSYTNWGIRYDDISSGFTYFPGAVSKPNIFLADEDNYKNLTDKKQFSGISKNYIPADNSFVFDVPSSEKNWYCVFNGDNSLTNYSYLQAAFSLYSNPLTSINNKSIDANNNITIFPNPATDYIYIQPLDGSTIKLFDMLGVIVYEIHPMTASYRLNIENLAPGMYFIKIGNIIKKFVKR